MSIGISVLIPTYNRATFIVEAIDSVLCQLDKKDEIVVVDDGSTDNTKEIIKKYDKTENFRYIKKKHTNAPDTRNRAIKEAKNEWLLWLDSDDVMIKGVLNSYRKAIRKYSKVKIFYGNLKILNNGKIYNRIDKDYYKKNSQLLNDFIFVNVLPNPCCLVKKNIYEKYGDYNVDFIRAHDYEFWSRIIYYELFKNINRFVCRYRFNDDSLSFGKNVNRDFELKIVESLLKKYSLDTIFNIGDTNINVLARNYNKLGNMFKKYGVYKKAEIYFKKVLELKEPDKDEIINANFHLGDIAKTNKKKNWKVYYKKGLNLLENKNNLSNLDRYRIASFYKKLEDFVFAKRLFSLLIGRKIDNKIKSGAYFHLGEICYQENDFEKSLVYFKKCLSLNENHKLSREYIDEISNANHLLNEI